LLRPQLAYRLRFVKSTDVRKTLNEPDVEFVLY